ncbi:uncharacterized protein LOC104855957 isoform X2 [Fukomys damarensis]|uniref:uncharacterized protein LOC104855957 isoform X2 n=1 Tax=Fukomys damarensis TaxID=885580 RepID=UPI00053F35C9|nr:uncharacterized protein LOC104855957 isoform X2 [Fukomys damarensis]XP_010613345.1 uncharacterized protein LOC104855957 isoform X2 [Fukomys damarensis]XP_033618928.1 uncharacterized protein LOC104855957 isoform X2 [Fukomys damarensis]
MAWGSCLCLAVGEGGCWEPGAEQSEEVGPAGERNPWRKGMVESGFESGTIRNTVNAAAERHLTEKQAWKTSHCWAADLAQWCHRLPRERASSTLWLCHRGTAGSSPKSKRPWKGNVFQSVQDILNHGATCERGLPDLLQKVENRPRQQIHTQWTHAETLELPPGIQERTILREVTEELKAVVKGDSLPRPVFLADPGFLSGRLTGCWASFLWPTHVNCGLCQIAVIPRGALRVFVD